MPLKKHFEEFNHEKRLFTLKPVSTDFLKEKEEIKMLGFFLQCIIEKVSCIFTLWCPWCNGYCRRKWTRQHKFKS